MGVLYKQTGQAEDAERHFLTAHRLNKSSAEPLVNLAGLYVETKRFDLAIRIGEQAVKADSTSAAAFFNLGIALFNSAKFDRSETMLKKALDLAPQKPQTRLMLANVYIKLGRHESLLAELSSYLKENPQGQERAAVERMRMDLLKKLGRSEP